MQWASMRATKALHARAAGTTGRAEAGPCALRWPGVFLDDYYGVRNGTPEVLTITYTRPNEKSSGHRQMRIFS